MATVLFGIVVLALLLWALHSFTKVSPQTAAVVLKTDLGTVLHSGDWKLDENPLTSAPTDEARLRVLGEEGVTALVCDSTNAVRDGISPSEADVAVTLDRLIREAPRRVAVTTFASNVARICSVAKAAQAAGRELVVVGRAMHRVIEAAQATITSAAARKECRGAHTVKDYERGADDAAE